MFAGAGDALADDLCEEDGDGELKVKGRAAKVGLEGGEGVADSSESSESDADDGGGELRDELEPAMERRRTAIVDGEGGGTIGRYNTTGDGENRKCARARSSKQDRSFFAGRSRYRGIRNNVGTAGRSRGGLQCIMGGM